MQFNTTDRQLLYDIRSEIRKTNELFTQLLEALRSIAKDTESKEIKSKEDATNGSLSKSGRRSVNSKPGGSSTERSGKRKTLHDK